MSNSSLYEQDFYAWANEQAALLRDGRLAEADIANIAEEIESLGRSEKRELVNRLAVLLTHLLKWQYQPGLRSTSWRLTIEEQRQRLADHLAENPSLRATLDGSITSAYRLGRIAAARETGRDRSVFPVICAWSPQQILSDDFWPEAA